MVDVAVATRILVALDEHRVVLRELAYPGVDADDVFATTKSELVAS